MVPDPLTIPVHRHRIQGRAQMQGMLVLVLGVLRIGPSLLRMLLLVRIARPIYHPTIRRHRLSRHIRIHTLISTPLHTLIRIPIILHRISLIRTQSHLVRLCTFIPNRKRRIIQDREDLYRH